MILSSYCKYAVRSSIKLSTLRMESRLAPGQMEGFRLNSCRFFTSSKDDQSQPPNKKEEPALEKLFHSNAKWVKKMNDKDPEYFPKLASGQSPDFLYIGCSDSRVSITDLTGVDLGELFVHRNIANLVVSSDLNLLSVLTYAVRHLNVRHILVTGHYDCGGVRAAVMKKDHGQVLDAWLQNIRDVYRLHKTELDGIQDAEDRHRRLVELNVLEQCLNLYKTSVVQRSRLETHAHPNHKRAYPRIHGLIFDPATGLLKKIPIDFRAEVAELSSTYDLFDLQEFESDAHMVKK